MRKSLKAISSNKSIFGIIIVFELLFLSFLSIALFTYSQSIVGPLQNINENLMSQKWMQELPTEKNLQELNIPATDVAAIEAEKQKMVAATIRLYISIIALFVLFCGSGWALSYRIALNQTWKKTFVDFGKVSVVAFFGLSVLFLLLHSAIILLTNQFFLPNASQTYVFVLPLFLAALLFYFIPISFALAGTVALKEVLQKTLHAGVRKCRFLFSFYGVCVLLVGGLSFAMLKVAGVSFLASMVAGVLLLASIAFSRVVLIKSLSQ